MSLRIVFVCSGNICRSPMAEAIARRELEERDHSGMVISMGTLGLVGRSASSHAIRALEELDLDISDHRSQGVSVGLLDRADYVPIMTPKHRRELLERDADLEPSLVPLWQYGDHPATDEGIPDPVGSDLETFRTCRDILVDSIDRWLDDELDS
jgi:protein-tyrosine-phosphatase